MRLMTNTATSEILQSLAAYHCPELRLKDTSWTDQPESNLWCENLSKVIKNELRVVVTPTEIRLAGSLSAVSNLVERRFNKNRAGKTLPDIYHELEKMAREEYHPKIPYEWCAEWDNFLKVGNWLTRPEGLDSVEIVMRMECQYRIEISDEDASRMSTVGQTVRYLWDNI